MAPPSSLLRYVALCPLRCMTNIVLNSSNGKQDGIGIFSPLLTGQIISRHSENSLLLDAYKKQKAPMVLLIKTTETV